MSVVSITGIHVFMSLRATIIVVLESGLLRRRVHLGLSTVSDKVESGLLEDAKRNDPLPVLVSTMAVSSWKDNPIETRTCMIVGAML